MNDNKKDNAPNLDLIQMVQQARMQHDAEATPSDVTAVYWIEVKCPTSPPPTAHSGRWVRQVPIAAVDALWERIKTATEAGQLGYKAKVATAPRSGGAADVRMIQVCTVDRNDAADVARVRAALAGFGDDWIYEE